MKDLWKRQRYENLDGVSTIASFRELRRWRQERKMKHKDLSYTVPHIQHLEIDKLRTNVTDVSVTWIGHASFLLQMDGLNILTDPVWANRMGFERRLSPPGLPLGELPNIDIVLISHGHYDHLHLPSLRQVPGQPVIAVPAGLDTLLKRKGFRNLTTLSWWEEFQVKETNFTFVPAQHWFRRTLWDLNTSHWGGWVLHSGRGQTLYFAGDSGYFRGFKEIGKRFNIDVAMLPIGAYEPEWFMKNQHVSPEEAVQAFLDLQAQIFIPMHYGAFRLADDTPREALERLHVEWKRQALPEDRLRVLKLGETLFH